jgi:CRISPR-associated endoribonuclease Cas6
MGDFTLHAYVKLRMEPSSPAIPIHYNYLAQAAIYGALPGDLASRLHDEGYAAGNRKFKMFSFSRLIGRFILDREAGTITFPEDTTLVITSPDLKFFLSLMNNLLTQNRIRIGQSLFEINELRFDEQKVEGEELAVRTLSPVVAYSTLLRPEGGKYTCYYQPGESEFNKLITGNLCKKHEAFYSSPPPVGEVRARPLDRPRLHVTLPVSLTYCLWPWRLPGVWDMTKPR